MINRLAKDSEKDLLALAEMFGGLAFTKESEKVWFKRRFAMFQDIMKDSWVYQELRQEMLEEGLEQGRVQGLEQGRERHVKHQRALLAKIVQSKFPVLQDLVEQQTKDVHDPDLLQALLYDLLSTSEVEAARRLLTCADKSA